ncbi:MAG: DNA repair protein RecN [Ahrensia sp.]|nr:DNA repair protein RecN [Ahrensia sp.]
MLSLLSIRDIVLIRSLDIEFSEGLAVLSGETGAGKSILLDSLSLALGARGDGGLVRSGAKQGQVTAVFDVSAQHPIADWLVRHDLVEAGDAPATIILRRTQNVDGRTRAFINDNPVSVSLLREAGQMLVEIHGQHEERALVDADAHRALVDAFGGLDELCQRVAAAYGEWKASREALNKMRARIQQAARESAYLRASVDELTTLAPQPGEEEDLADRRQTMMSAEKIVSDINEAYEVLNGSTSPVPTLVSAMRSLERKSGAASGLLDEVVDAFGAALDALATAEAALEEAQRKTQFEPRELEETEERLFALRAASRKYAVAVEQLPDLAQQLASDLAELDSGETRLAELEEQTASARKTLEAQAATLSEARSAAAEELSQCVMAELPDLKLGEARLFVEHSTDKEAISASGRDTIEFHVQTNPGTRPGPLMKVASGGELSRFLLALKVALADHGSAPTLIFDEIDTGVGGAVADAIGARLAKLAVQVQVLSVTHAPQVAARASNHLVISKGSAGKDEAAVETRVKPVEADARRDEIARMLAGAQVTQEAKAAAESLLAGARL